MLVLAQLLITRRTQFQDQSILSRDPLRGRHQLIGEMRNAAASNTVIISTNMLKKAGLDVARPS